MFKSKFILVIFVCSLVEKRQTLVKTFKLFDSKFLSDFMYKKNVFNNVTFLKYNLNDLSYIKFNNSVKGLSIINANNPNITKNIQSNNL